MAADAEDSSDAAVTEVARLYDMAVSHLDAMSEISTTLDHVGFTKRLAGRKRVLRGYRCGLLAAGHLAEGRVREALALLDRADELVGLARADFAESAGEATADDLALLKKLQGKLRRGRCRLRADAFMQQNPDAAASATKDKQVALDGAASEADVVGKTLRDQLDVFAAGTLAARGEIPLTHFPPQFEAVPPKPLFFDLASSAIEFDVPSITERAKPPEAASTLGAMTGALAGGVKNLFGWGGRS